MLMSAAIMHSFCLKFGFHSAVDEQLVVSVFLGAWVCSQVHGCEAQRMWQSSRDAGAFRLGQDMQFSQTAALHLPLTNIQRRFYRIFSISLSIYGFIPLNCLLHNFYKISAYFNDPSFVWIFFFFFFLVNLRNTLKCLSTIS